MFGKINHLKFGRYGEEKKYFIKPISSDYILEHSMGLINNYQTLDENGTQVDGGLFCEKVFGNVKEYRCDCGDFGISRHDFVKKNALTNEERVLRAIFGEKSNPRGRFIEHDNDTCCFCKQKITPVFERLQRFGHIELASPVIHTWFYKSTPNIVSELLGIKSNDIKNIIWFKNGIVLKSNFNDIKVGDIVTRDKYNLYKSLYHDDIVVGLGSESIRYLLNNIDMFEMRELLYKKYNSSNDDNRKTVHRRIEILEAFIWLGFHPRDIVVDILPVIPLDLRPISKLSSDNYAISDINKLYADVIYTNNRLYKMMELKAPELVLIYQKNLLQNSINNLFDNGRYEEPLLDKNNHELVSLRKLLPFSNKNKLSSPISTINCYFCHSESFVSEEIRFEKFKRTLNGLLIDIHRIEDSPH